MFNLILREDGKFYHHTRLKSSIMGNLLFGRKESMSMIIPEKMQQVLSHEGAAAIATQGEDGPHLVNTWNSYIKATDDGRLLFPAGHMNTTESNIEKDNHVLITVGSRDVQGFNGPGTGFLINGTAAFLKSGPEFDDIKSRFPWARAAVEIKVTSAKQTL